MTLAVNSRSFVLNDGDWNRLRGILGQLGSNVFPQLETDINAELDLKVPYTGAIDNVDLGAFNLTLGDNSELIFGSDDAALDWSTAQATANTLVLGLGDTAKSLIICDYADRDKDFDHSAFLDPTLVIHSAGDPDTANNQWTGISHDGSNGIITVGTGSIEFTKGIRCPDNVQLKFGNSNDIKMHWDTGDVVDSFKVSLSSIANSLIITNAASIADDHGVAAQNNPTLHIFSDTDVGGGTTDEWLSLTHNGTNAVIRVGTGSIDIGSKLLVSDNNEFINGTGGDTKLDYSTAQSTANTLVWGLSNQGNSIIFTNIDFRNKDHDHGAQLNPTIFLHSDDDPDSDNTKWLGLAHNGANGVISVGSGVVQFTAGRSEPVVIKTADYTILTADHTIFADATSNTVDITLPAAPVTGRILNIKCIDATFLCQILRNGKDIDGASSDISLAVNDSVTLQYDGTEWWII